MKRVSSTVFMILGLIALCSHYSAALAQEFELKLPCCGQGGCCLAEVCCVESVDLIDCSESMGGAFLGEGTSCPKAACAANKCKYTSTGAGVPMGGCPTSECNVAVGTVYCSTDTCTSDAQCPAREQAGNFPRHCRSGGTCNIP